MTGDIGRRSPGSEAISHDAAMVFQDGVTRFVRVNPGEKLLDAALRQGVRLPMDCREGVCGTCRGRCESGQVDMEYCDEDALNEGERGLGYVLACQARLRSDCSFHFDVDSSFCAAAPRRFQGHIAALRAVSAAAAMLEIRLDEGSESLKFLPGQYARLQVPGTDEHRAYSYANAADDSGRLRFLVRLLPSGVMSDYLRSRCRTGDAIQLEGPLGGFYLRRVERPLLFVAGGTGLSAFLSMLDHLVLQGGTEWPVRLHYGVNSEGDLSELERLEHFVGVLPDFRYRIAVSQPTSAWTGERGMVTTLLDEQSLAVAPFDAYLCGPPPMIDGVQAWLGSRTLAEHRVYFEKFVSS